MCPNRTSQFSLCKNVYFGAFPLFPSGTRVLLRDRKGRTACCIANQTLVLSGGGGLPPGNVWGGTPWKEGGEGYPLVLSKVPPWTDKQIQNCTLPRPTYAGGKNEHPDPLLSLCRGPWSILCHSKTAASIIYYLSYSVKQAFFIFRCPCIVFLIVLLQTYMMTFSKHALIIK